MTKTRVFGEDTPFGKWLRENPRLESIECSLSVTDRDFLFQQYRISVDKVGTRKLNFMLNLEVKSSNGRPSFSQQETLYFNHQLLSRKIRLVDLSKTPRSVWHFGQYVLSMPGSSPDEFSWVTWLKFAKDGNLIPHKIDILTLESILKFDISPDFLLPIGNARRHHATKYLTIDEQMPLGFTTYRIIRRSR